MSGKPWTPERKAAWSRRQKVRWTRPSRRRAQAERSRATMADPEKRAAASKRMKALNERMRRDKALKKKCVRGQRRARRKKRYRAVRSIAMKKTMARPENREKARWHCCDINRDPAVRARQWDGRRRKQQEALRKASEPLAPPRPAVFGDVDAIFLQLLAREAQNCEA